MIIQCKTHSLTAVPTPNGAWLTGSGDVADKVKLEIKSKMRKKIKVMEKYDDKIIKWAYINIVFCDVVVVITPG